MSELSELVEGLAQQPIEDMEDVDQIPDLVTTLEDVIYRLQTRWKEEFPGHSPA